MGGRVSGASARPSLEMGDITRTDTSPLASVGTPDGTLRNATEHSWHWCANGRASGHSEWTSVAHDEPEVPSTTRPHVPCSTPAKRFMNMKTTPASTRSCRVPMPSAFRKSNGIALNQYSSRRQRRCGNSRRRGERKRESISDATLGITIATSYRHRSPRLVFVTELAPEFKDRERRRFGFDPGVGPVLHYRKISFVFEDAIRGQHTYLSRETMNDRGTSIRKLSQEAERCRCVHN